MSSPAKQERYLDLYNSQQELLISSGWLSGKYLVDISSELPKYEESDLECPCFIFSR